MSTKIMLALFGLLALTTGVFAGDGELAANKISPELLKNAHAVMRYDNYTVEIRNVKRQKLNRKYAVTILDEDGEEFATFGIPYDKFISIESIDGVLYDANGKKVKSVKKSDIADVSNSSNLADDERAKFHRFYYKQYPYTVEYEVDQEIDGTFFLPHWQPISAYHLAVEKSSMLAIVPADYQLRYRAFNYEGEPKVGNDRDKKTLTWTVNNLPALNDIYASPGWSRIVPLVLLAPSKFSIEDYSGDMTDWKEFGKFIQALKTGRDQLPPNVKQKVHEIADAAPTKEQKIKALYEYMQANTRYISIQLGIGGWRPFDATFVATKGYGDCKALSNYMYSLLKEAGINSYYTLISAGEDEEDIVTDFPSNQFNHVILCVPLENDSMWLECTSQSKAAGYMGGFTGNRHALIITDDGGKLVTTPSYSASENTETSVCKGILDEAGNLKFQAANVYRAVEQDDLPIHAWSDEQKLKRLKNIYDLPTYDVSSFKYEELKGKIPTMKESLEMVAPNYATVSGKRIFIIPNILSRAHRKLIQDETRKCDVRIISAYTDIDTVELTIPTGYQPESIPSDVTLENKFGRYSAKVKVVGDKVYYYRRYEHLNGYFPAKDYMEMSKFYDEVYKADRNKVVFVKK